MNRKIYTTAFLLLTLTCLAATGKNESVHSNLCYADSANSNIITVYEKKDAVRLFPNPSFNGTVTVCSALAQPLHFYIFDVEGVMINQTVLADKQKHTINNLKKGVYVYDAFLNDISIEHGQIIVK